MRALLFFVILACALGACTQVSPDGEYAFLKYPRQFVDPQGQNYVVCEIYLLDIDKVVIGNFPRTSISRWHPCDSIVEWKNLLGYQVLVFKEGVYFVESPPMLETIIFSSWEALQQRCPALDETNLADIESVTWEQVETCSPTP